MFNEWHDFKGDKWKKEIDVRDFIISNFNPYNDGESFLSQASGKTENLIKQVNQMINDEIILKKIAIDLDTIAGIDSFAPGYIDKDNEIIVGLQADAPLKRIVNPYGGIRMIKQSLKENGYEIDSEMNKIFTEYRKTHNDGVFSAYTDEMKLAKHVGLLTGLPDAYGRGRIIGDYRRIALYGIDFLIQQKQNDLNKISIDNIDEDIRLREEVYDQIVALKKIKNMAQSYGYDIAKPASNSKEAVQWLYFGYLAAVKESNGAAMSFGRNTAFIDVYMERDLQSGMITEKEAQEIIDQLVIKLRLVRHLRTNSYDELFAGDPTWITESIGGISNDGIPLVTKTAFRFLHTLENLDPAPEPNMTVLWSEKLPEAFKKYCAKLSINTDSIQYENDDIMRPIYGDDYAIACCVSAMEIGKRMQLFGARCNLGKALLYAINGGIDEKTGQTVVHGIEPVRGDLLNIHEVMHNFEKVIQNITKLYVDTMNVIHYMHDKYAYEASEMALHDTNVKRFMAFGIAGLSVVVDSLSAIEYAKVKPIRDGNGIAIDFETIGDYPMFGNDDDRVDDYATWLVTLFSSELKKHKAYRDAEHTLSVLTITSNVMYGKKTGSTPDGRKVGEPFAPGANPMHGRDKNGALASLNSVAKIPYKDYCQDGISNTFSIVPEALGQSNSERINNLTAILDGYFAQNAHHLNVNVLNRQTLIDAMKHPEKYPQLTIRVSGYAVHFNRLSKDQQIEVINRTFHDKI